MVEPLSKRAQLSLLSIQTLVMLSSLLPPLSRLGFKKGTFWDIFRLWGPHLGIPVEWLLVSKGSGLPSSSSLLSCLNLLFWWPCWNPLDNLSQDGQDCHTQNNSSFSSGTAWLHWQNGQYGWLASPIKFGVSWSSPLEDLASSSPSNFTLESSSVPMLPTMVDQAMKVWLPFSFLEGNKFPMPVAG